MSPSAAQVAVELKRLVGWGVNRQRLQRRTLLIKLPKVASVAGGSTPLQLAAAAEEVIKDACRTLPKRESEAIQILLKLDPRYADDSADERRRVVMQILGIHLSLEAWRQGEHEIKLLELLAHELLGSLECSQDGSSKESGAGYTLDLVETVACLDESGRFSACENLVTLRPTRPLSSYVAGHAYYGDDARDVITYRVMRGGRLDWVSDPNKQGYRTAHIKFEPKLKPGRPHSIFFRTEVQSTAPTNCWYDISVSTPTKELVVGARFAMDYLPKVAWSFEDLDPQSVPGEPSPGTELTINDGYAECIFNQPEPRGRNGIAWRYG